MSWDEILLLKQEFDRRGYVFILQKTLFAPDDGGDALRRRLGGRGDLR